MDDSDSQITLQAATPPGLASAGCIGRTSVARPDRDRVGEQSRLPALATRAVELSRTSTEFSAPGSGLARALADRYLSRRPIRIARSGNAITLSVAPDGPELVVDGDAVTDEHHLPLQRARTGVVIDIANRVTLLLHELDANPTEPIADLGFIGANAAMINLRRNILRVADLPVPVLIRGETGTGKDLVARAVHRASSRASRRYVSVNMAAIPPTTAASELFGHRRGAFTGAVSDHSGYFNEADGGSLFLDEIGATPGEIQPMLLRALESHEIQPLGTSAPRRVDVRLIAATDADLERAICNESFRAALLHRLEGYQLFIPPLRERRDDIGRLSVHFLRREFAATGELAKLTGDAGTDSWLPPDFIAKLVRLDWPGNVRQLRNVIRQFAISSRGATSAVLDPAVLRLLASAASPEPDPTDAPRPVPADLCDDELIAALRAQAWRVNEAAAKLGISRSSMYERIKKCPLIRSAKDLPAAEIEACKAELTGDIPAMAARLEVSTRALRLRMSKLGLL